MESETWEELSETGLFKRAGRERDLAFPIYRSPNDDNGYDISDYCEIMEEFGTMEEFDRLLKAMHERGLKLMMDLVVNHTSDEHPWFQAALKDKNSPYRDYYFFPGWETGRSAA